MRIVSAAALVALVAAGCGGGARPHEITAQGVPRELAQGWARQASAIASAASAGNDCRALQLASSLRDQVIAAEPRVPAGLRSPLVTSVNSLADRLTCVPQPQTVTVAPKPTKPPDKRHEHGGHDHKGHGGDKGDGG